MTRFTRDRVAIVYPNDGTDIRIGKNCRSLSAAGYDTHFLGWDRRPGAQRTFDLGRATRHVMDLETVDSRGTAAGTLRFATYVSRTLRKLRPEFVCGVNEEYTFLVLPLRRVSYRFLICDIFDSWIDRQSEAAAARRWTATAVAHLGRSGADRLIVTDQARYGRLGRYRAKTTIIENYPEDPGEAVSRLWPEGPAKVYVAGTLSAGRGLREILAAVESDGAAEIVAAGWPYDRYAREVFLHHPKVDYRGLVSAAESLELAARCDAVFAFYSPTSTNNRMASPNKVYDAMAVGRPVIINGEVELSRWVAQNELGAVCPYADLPSLTRFVGELRQRRPELNRFADRVRRIFLDGYTWSHMESRLLEVYAGLRS